MLIIKNSLFDEIDDKEKRPLIVISTDRLISAIDRLGIDYRGPAAVSFFDYMSFMTRDQIDLLFRYNPVLYHDACKTFLYTLYSFVGNHDKDDYIMQKFMEIDKIFSFVTTEMRIYDLRSNRFEHVFLLDLMSKTDNYDRRIKCSDTLLNMVQNHQKKYLRLFDLLKHHIE